MCVWALPVGTVNPGDLYDLYAAHTLSLISSCSFGYSLNLSSLPAWWNMVNTARTHTHTHTHTHIDAQTHAHAQTHARTHHARMHAPTHTHTHTRTFN